MKGISILSVTSELVFFSLWLSIVHLRSGLVKILLLDGYSRNWSKTIFIKDFEKLRVQLQSMCELIKEDIRLKVDLQIACPTNKSETTPLSQYF